MEMTEVMPGLFRFDDSCAVYLLVDGDDAMAIDYGSGAWRAVAAAAGLPAPSTVLLTHHHADQCAGLEKRCGETQASHGGVAPNTPTRETGVRYCRTALPPGPLYCDSDSAERNPNHRSEGLGGLPLPAGVGAAPHEVPESFDLSSLDVHAPAGERVFLEAAGVAAFWAGRDAGGVPATYAAVKRGLEGVTYDLGGFQDHWWGLRRVRCLHTPGHGPHALSYVVDWAGRQVVFSGDAVHAGGTVWQPYCLEWDHWTGGGALAAWEGLRRLGGIAVDLLCPSHGPVIDGDCRATIAQAADRVLALVRAKGQIADGMPDCYITPTRRLAGGAWELHPRLYQFGANSYLLLDATGSEALLIDPFRADIAALDPLLAELPPLRITATTATHYHYDHCDALDDVRQRHGARVLLHPRVAEILRDPAATDCPWRPGGPIVADALLPDDGEVTWADLTIRCAPFPGQTWWHCLLMTEVDGERWAFAGDNIQPASRWNGTGGFCSYNGSRLVDGFGASAARLLAWAPHRIYNGHGTFQHMHAPTYAAIRDWAATAEAAVRALCPSGDLRRDYYLHAH